MPVGEAWWRGLIASHPVTETPHSAHSLIPCFAAGKFALAVDPA
eukprot:COSAG01_NODE_27325_length_688_cov_2.432937_1_plen_43_part_01